MVALQSVRISFFVFFAIAVHAQSAKVVLDWNIASIESAEISNISFAGAYTVGEATGESIPYYSITLDIDHLVGSADIDFRPSKIHSQPLPATWTPMLDKMELASARTFLDRGKNKAVVSVFPYQKQGNLYYCVEAFDYTLVPTSQRNLSRNPTDFTYISKLETGDVYKMSIDDGSGIYKIDFETINALGISASEGAKIHILGKGGGVVPQSNLSSRVDDLAEIAIYEVGLNDGSWDAGDYVLFYGEGAATWKQTNEGTVFQQNPYDVKNYYYLKFYDGPKKTITLGSQEQSAINFDTYTKYQRFEEEKVNLLGDYNALQGSGKVWFGDQFKNNRTQTYTSKFDMTDRLAGSAVSITLAGAARSKFSSTVKLTYGGDSKQMTISSTSISNIDADYAFYKTLSETFASSNSSNLSVDYLQNGDTESSFWLDYLQVVSQHELRYKGSPMTFTNELMTEYGSVGFDIQGVESKDVVWNITDPINVGQLYSIEVNIGVRRYIDNNQNANRRYILFTPSAIATKPQFVGKVENQNLHGIDKADMVIVYHSKFEQAALDLAQHRESYNGMNVVTVDIDQVWEEFSSGRIDPAGLRDFFVMLYQRDPGFKYVVLIGDASYDFRNINGLAVAGNYIPAYETDESLDPIYAYPSDDFYALLDTEEGQNLAGGLDVAIGRFPVNTVEDANAMVKKIIHYETASACLGPWRGDVTFLADDGNGDLHVRDCNNIAKTVEEDEPYLHQNKIYFDAYKQISTPGGERYPEANADLNNNVQNGQLVTCYLGHGGPKGWAQERVLQVDDVNGWDNIDNMTVMVTATCSFAGYDNPELVSAGEHAILNPKGGVVGLLTTVRSVFTSSNAALTRKAWEKLFADGDGQAILLGESLRQAKNDSGGDFRNNNKFTLLGDPAMRLALPKYEVVLTSINGGLVTTESQDTISALQKVTLEGEVVDGGNLLNDFNGELNIKLYDKPTSITTLVNDTESKAYTFDVRNTLLFRGKASVVNGKFKIEFILPKDIKFQYGYGKLHMYASDGQSRDAIGYYDGLTIGGSAEGLVEDNQGPEIELYMNDFNFVNGGRTNSEPVLLGRLSDANGINVSNTSIGHDLKVTLDNDTQKSYVVNDNYEAELDDYTKGLVTYQLNDLTEGEHTIRLIAWDVLNNSSTADLRFVVSTGDAESLTRVFNYPNPFSTQTNFMFEHDYIGGNIEVMIKIFTLSGKNIKTLQYSRLSSGFREVDLNWDGRDDFGSKLATGIYLYQIVVVDIDTNTEKTSDFQKLVIMH